MSDSRPVLIFDGVCNMCNATVNFILDRDKKEKLMFTANQHAAGQEILTKFGMPTDEVDTFYLVDEGNIYDRSSAVLRVARHLGFPWNLGYVFMIIPKFIRDAVYKVVARNRYKWFGKRDACRLATPSERARFLE